MIAVTTISPRDFDAVLFDLDGVLTKTASVHASAWKKLFDSFLETRTTHAGETFVPFDIANDYGIEVYETSIALVRKLRVQGIKTAVVFSSVNYAAVLNSASISMTTYSM